MTYEIAYNKDITDIKKENGKYVKYYKNGTSIETTASDAAYLVAGMQYYFLTHKGKEPVCKELAANPSTLFDTVLTDTGEKNGNPLIDEFDTLSIISTLMHGIAQFDSNRSKDNSIGYGIGYLIYKLYEAYERSTSKDVHKKFMTFITIGTFVAQMKRKPLGVQIYLGIYDAWEWAKDCQETIFKNPKFAAENTCCNTVSYRDYDPIHDMSKSPSNMRRISIDNVILTYCITKHITTQNGRKAFLDAEEAKKTSQIYCFSCRIFSDVLPAYDIRCTHFLGSEDEKKSLKITDNKARYIILDMRPGEEDIFSIEDCPYLFYLISQITCFQGSAPEYHKIAMEYTGKALDKLDPDCPVIWHLERLQAAEELKKAARKRKRKVRIILLICAVALIAFFVRHPYAALLCYGALFFGCLARGMAVAFTPQGQNPDDFWGSMVPDLVMVVGSGGRTYSGWWI